MRKQGLIAAAVMFAAVAARAETKTYQVTGSVVEVGPDSITVEKNNENWTIGRNADTKVTGELKKGQKVTVVYGMTATSIESKAAATKPAAAAKPKKTSAGPPPKVTPAKKH